MLTRRLAVPFRSRRFWLAVVAAGLVCCLTAPQLWARYHLRMARTALEEYRPEQASIALAKCLGVWPNSADVRLLASRAARQAGDVDAADAELRVGQRLAGGSSEEVAFEWALLQASAGNVREVEEYLQARVERDPRQGPLVWEALIEGYLRVYRTIDAMATVEHWLGRDPENIRALELRGITFVTGKGVKRGSDDLRRVVERDPTRVAARWRLVRCLLDLGAYEEAMLHLERFAREQPGNPDVQARVARCQIMLGRRDEARQTLDDSLAGHPENGLTLRTRGQLALLEQRPGEAEVFLRRAAAAWPADYQTHYLLFQALQQQGRTDEARTLLRTAEEVKDRAERVGELQSRKLAEQPLDPALHYEMGILLMRSGQAVEGARWLQSALGLDPEFAPAHTALADYFDRAGDKDRAAEHRRKTTPR